MDVDEVHSEAVLESPNLLVPQLIPTKSDSKAEQDHPNEQPPPKVQCHVHIIILWW